MSDILNPAIWEKHLREKFHEELLLKMQENNLVVLRLGPNIGLTAAQVNAAIDDADTDPIIRNALIAFKAKLRIADTPAAKVNVDKIYGYKKMYGYKGVNW